MTALAPGPASLDTGQHLDIGSPHEAPRRPFDAAAAADRVRRNDQAKHALSGLVSLAATRYADRDDLEGAATLSKLAGLLEECRGGDAFRDGICGAYHVRPRSCRVRLCPDCERARSARLVERYDELVDGMADYDADTGARIRDSKFWTFTIPNVPPGELAGGIALLVSSFAAMRRRAFMRGGSCRTHGCDHPRRHRAELTNGRACRCGACIGCRACQHRSVTEGVYAVEVTWNATARTWHPHLHALMSAPWIAWSEVRDAWRATTCDLVRRAEALRAGRRGRVPRCSHPVDERGIAVAPCRGASIVYVEAAQDDGDEASRRKAVRETLKYVTKGLLDREGRPLPGVGPDELGELLLAVRNRRLVAGWGALRNVRDDDQEGLDPTLYVTDPTWPSLMGLPLRCPSCGSQAAWELPVRVQRRYCRPLEAGGLTWRPPPAARA